MADSCYKGGTEMDQVLSYEIRPRRHQVCVVYHRRQSGATNIHNNKYF